MYCNLFTICDIIVYMKSIMNYELTIHTSYLILHTSVFPFSDKGGLCFKPPAKKGMQQPVV
jgi:hypothetical protein